MNYESHAECMSALRKAQEADQDNREKAQEAHNFVDARGGQWEDGVSINTPGDKPKYTFDQTNAIIDQIYGQMTRTDFDIQVRPMNGTASKDVAQTYDGLVRNIEAVSNAEMVYNLAGRNMITAGIDGWEVVNKYVDGDSFEQDLVIQRIPDFINRCWLGAHSEPDGSDAQCAWILEGMEKEAFKKKFPDRAADASVEAETDSGHKYYHRHDLVMWGQLRYLQEESREIVLMSNNRVYEVNDDFEKVADDLARLGVTEVDRRTRKQKVMYTRRFDSRDWIDEKPVRTIFRNWLNIIPLYAHFKITDKSKLIYWGAVEKLMDSQRVLNYALSREIEEGALAARKTFIVTDAMIEGYEDEWESLNTAAAPYIRRNVDPDDPAGVPIETGGPQMNQGLRSLSEGMMGMMNQVAGLYSANMGDNPNAQSGVALNYLQDRGDIGNNIYMTAREIAQCHTGRILVDTIPRVYKPGRQQRILNPDGSYEMETVGQPVIDNATGEIVYQYDLSEGKYDVLCRVGASFKSRQSQTLAAFDALGKYAPSLIESNADIILANTDAPGMDKAADRIRWALLVSGAIPEEQQTDEEREKLALLQQQQGQQPDPNMVLAMAEDKKAEADLLAEQNKQLDMQAKYALKADELALREAELQIKAHETGAKIQGIEAKALRDVVEARVKAVDSRVKQGQALLGAIK